MKKIYSSFLFLMALQANILAQTYWTTIVEGDISLEKKSVRYTIPEKFATYELQLEAIQSILAKAVPQKSDPSQNVLIRLPLPDGSSMEFNLFETQVIHPKLAAKYPMIKTYAGYNIDKTAKVHLDMTTKGLHAVIDHSGKSIYIDPYAAFQDRYYMSYFASDLIKTKKQSDFVCGVDEAFIAANLPENETSFDESQTNQVLQKSSAGAPVKLRTYRTAIACTAEYTMFHGGTKESGLSAVATAVNRLNLVFERDLAIHLELIENNDQLIFLNEFADPFTNGNTGAMIDESQAAIDQQIGFGLYDFGHVFGTSGSFAGLAQRGSVCGGSKARGASTMNVPVNDAFVISIVAHEMGHQMGANHSMSSCHNVNSGTAYEPGSGSTIMSYAGICGPVNNIVGDADDYYFTYSLSEMFNYMKDGTGDDCAETTVTNNTTPDINIPIEDGFFIPINTPFEMTAEASDAEGDHLTYAWEQMDLGDMMTAPGEPEGNSPLFRSFIPNDNPTRVFPRMETIVTNGSDKAEVLPPYSRDMTFRCTARDNNIEGGGVSWDTVEFEATETAGPFLVANPNTDMIWEVGSYVAVNWEVANTNKAPVNCQAVDILLSLDGGYTYPIILAENAVNDGSEFVIVPNEMSNQARIKIKAADNIFFDISNTNFRIEAPSIPSYSLATSPDVFQVCLPETVAVNINAASVLGYNEAIELSVLSGLPADAIASFSATSILPTENTQLLLDFTNTTLEDTYEIIVQAIAPNADTLVRSIVLTTVSNNYTNLILDTPNDGESGVSGLPVFDWQVIEDADWYSIQVATNPSFATETMINEAHDLTAGPYSPAIILDENTLYYWRVIPYNECGEGMASKTFAFHSKSLSCNAEPAYDTPINVSASGAPSVESKITVIPDGIISDINVTQLKGSHEFFSDLRVKLVSPAGTSVTLFASKCANYNGNFNITMDDESPIAFSCPPNGVMRPQQALAAFVGESTAGTWTLQIEDAFGGSGGKIDDWSLEFCADINLSNPQLIRNEVLPLPPATDRAINADFLFVEDPDNADWQLTYTLVKNVEHGILLVEGEPITVGDQFNQGQITWNQLVYLHDGSESIADDFEFTVADGSGGWTGTHTFQIEIDENAVVATTDISNDTQLVIFPNPASEVLTIQTNNKAHQLSNIQIFNVLGTQIEAVVGNRSPSMTELNVSNLAAGVYIIQAQVGETLVSQKVTVL